MPALPRLKRAIVVLLAYSAIAALATWPLLGHFSSHIGGTELDPWQTLWGFWWWRHSGEFGGTPMFSRLLWWPDGAPLWFQTWDLPSALVVWPFWGWLSDKALYNLPLFLSFPLAGFAFSLLCRELWGGRLGPFLAGCLYSFSTFHFAHAGMELHLASMQWSPLYFLGLARTMRRRTVADAMLAGAALALATLASTYYLVFCAVGTLVLAWTGTLGDGPTLRSRTSIRHAAILCAVFLALAGWLLVGMARSYLTEPYLGGHKVSEFSADLESFFVPNVASVWSIWTPRSARWTGNQHESAAYIGYVVMGLAVLGWRRAKTVRGYLWLALVGAVIALGPLLHVGGVTLPVPLPEALLEILVPPISLSGMPTRFSWLTTFGVAVAAGAGLSWLCSRGRRERIAAVGLTMLALVEVWPRPFLLSNFPEPAIFTEWARDPGDWGVVDATAWSRPLWHQMAHRHPILTGYVSRLPERLLEDVRRTPGLRQFLNEPFSRGEALGVSPEETVKTLRAHKVRFVILSDTPTENPALAPLIERYRGGGIVIYEIPVGF